MQDFDLIETPENVELQRRLAGIGTRFLAGLFDTLIIVGVFLLLLLLFAIVGLPEPIGRGVTELQIWAIALLIAVVFAMYWGYFVFFELVTNGQSPGKRSERIRVVKDGGGAITFTDVAIRNLLRAVDGFGLYAVAGACMFFTAKSQRLGDLAAGTVVVSEGTVDFSAKADRKSRVRWEQEAAPQALRATGLSPEDFRTLRNFWVRREQLTREARGRLLRTLVFPILHRNGLATGDQTDTALEAMLYGLMTPTESGDVPGPGAGGAGGAP